MSVKWKRKINNIMGGELVNITKQQLKQIIKEELKETLNEAAETEYDRIVQTVKELLEVSTDGEFDLVGELHAIADYAENSSTLEEGMYNYDCPPGQRFHKYPDRPGGHCVKDASSPGTKTKRQPMSGAEQSQAYRSRPRKYEE